MKKKILFIILLLSIFILPVAAEELPFDFVNEFGLNSNSWEDINHTKTLKTVDGNYVVSQGNFIKLVKPSGEIVWSQELVELPDYDSIDLYIEGQNLLVAFMANYNPHIMVLDLANGEYTTNSQYSGGFFVDKIGDYYIVADYEGLYLYNSEFETPEKGIELYLLDNNSIFIENNKIYTLTCGRVLGASSSSGSFKAGWSCEPYISVLNSNLEVESSKKITNDNKIESVESFFKVENDFYVTSKDVFKIEANGKSTKVVDSETASTRYFSGDKVGNYIVLGGNTISKECGTTLKERKNVSPCATPALISVYDTSFNHITDLPLIEDTEILQFGKVYNITPTEKGFLAKWYDDENDTVNVTEYNTKYAVTTKTNGNGEITVNKIRAKDGDLIEITVTPKPGYVLDAMTIIDANGNRITTKNNTFVMPASDVIVEATFSAKNPNTGDIAILSITLFALLSAFVLIKQKKKLNFLK